MSSDNCGIGRRRDAHGREELFADGVPLAKIADEAGTPVYVYSAGSFRARYQRIKSAFAKALAPLEPIVAFSVKACPSLGILSLLAKEGAGFDVVSGGELLRVQRAGGDPKKVIFAGVGKTDAELALAIEAGVLQINVESEGELLRLDSVARARKASVRAALRVNPGLDPQTHRHLATGAKTSKFGVSVADAELLLSRRRALTNTKIVGMHVHIGSMLRDRALYTDALARLAGLAKLFGPGELETLDIGGGLAIATKEGPELPPEELAPALAEKILAIGARPILEPGRWIAAPSGCLVARVLDRKRAGDRTIVVLDAGMNDLIRPALYDAIHPVEAVDAQYANATMETVDLVGPVCESGDTLARSISLPQLNTGDLVAILDAGAYGFSMSSQYNSRPRAAEILADGNVYKVIRQRESFDDLIRGEST